MSFYPGGKAATPVIVCGPPRCGTRFVTDALNHLPRVAIQGEVIPALFERARAFLAEADAAIAAPKQKPQWRKTWDGRRAETMFALWTNLQKYAVVKAPRDVAFYGYKTPGHEKLWSFYEGYFTERKPLFVYCIRNFPDHYRSYITRWPKRRIEAAAAAYLESIDTCEAMRAALGERAQIFVLDALVAEGGGYLERFLARLPIPAPAERIARIDPREKANSAEVHARPRVELDDGQRAFIARTPELEARFRALAAAA
ncbi:MAG TPA: sulfotransferase [Amaricoccus sp.]|nr:sulfotransferase [Amaricoccus sp.]